MAAGLALVPDAALTRAGIVAESALVIVLRSLGSRAARVGYVRWKREPSDSRSQTMESPWTRCGRGSAAVVTQPIAARAASSP